MRGDLVLTNGEHTGKSRTFAEGLADFNATFRSRHPDARRQPAPAEASLGDECPCEACK